MPIISVEVEHELDNRPKFHFKAEDALGNALLEKLRRYIFEGEETHIDHYASGSGPGGVSELHLQAYKDADRAR